MSTVGSTELLLIFIIALLILGPERLPKLASQLGRWIGRARRTANQLRYQLEREIALSDVKNPPKKPKPPGEKQADAPAAGADGAEEADTSAEEAAPQAGPESASADSEAGSAAPPGDAAASKPSQAAGPESPQTADSTEEKSSDRA